MLTARRAQKACPSCRHQLLNLFQYGFAASRNTVSKSRTSIRSSHVLTASSNIRPDPINTAYRLRTFSTFAQLREGEQRPDLRPERSVDVDTPSGAPLAPTDLEIDTQAKADAIEDAQDVQLTPEAESVESIVLQARRTFGETLPKDYLTAEEYSLYERLYGPPLRETRGEDLDFLHEEAVAEEVGERRNVLMRETEEEGVWEEVELSEGGVEIGVREVDEDGNEIIRGEEDEEGDFELESEDVEEESFDRVNIQAGNKREIEVIMRLRRDMAAAAAQASENVPEEDEVDEEFEEEEHEEEPEEDLDEEFDGETGDSLRSHPHTIAGRWGTKPSTVNLPHKQFVQPITELLTRTNAKHLQEAAERAFGGPGLPYSSATPQSRKILEQKHIGLEAGQHKMSDIEADAYMAGVMPGTYAAVMSTLVESRKRLGPSWLKKLLLKKHDKDGPRFLDAGAGGGALVAWREVLQAEWDMLRTQGLVKGRECHNGKATVLTGPNALRHRMSRFLEDTTFLPRLPDYLHADNAHFLDGAPAQSGRKFFDVIVAPHTLLPLKEDFRRKSQIQNLWSLLDPNGGVLILIEKGIPRGFEAIAGARALLLDSHIASPNESVIEEELQSPKKGGERFRQKETGMIVAPCTNHSKCPMYTFEGTSVGRKDYCHFSQRFIRPPFLQKLINAKGKNHEDVRYSYIVVRKGVDERNHAATTTEEGFIQGEAATLKAFSGYEDTGDTRISAPTLESDLDDTSSILETATDPNFHPQALPRAILAPLKRRGHVTLDVCTPSGTIERWTVPKSFSKQAYRDARKSSHGDLWALGAKTRVLRNVRLGREYLEKDGRKGARKAKGGKLGGSLRQGEGKGKEGGAERARTKKKNDFVVDVSDRGYEGMSELMGSSVDRNRKRTKGGRKPVQPRELTEKDFE